MYIYLYGKSYINKFAQLPFDFAPFLFVSLSLSLSLSVSLSPVPVSMNEPLVFGAVKLWISLIAVQWCQCGLKRYISLRF